MLRFNAQELELVKTSAREAEHLVTRYYALAPREWARMRYEVKTQTEQDQVEILDSVLAHVICYEYTRRIGQEVLERSDLYRICLQDNRILETHGRGIDIDLAKFLLYVLTHELVHVVRFGQNLQRLDLPVAERLAEERSVEQITDRILGFNPGIDIKRQLHDLPRTFTAIP